jgi:Arc/MetJ-type ribon-helix-helix transcriptional regulator
LCVGVSLVAYVQPTRRRALKVELTPDAEQWVRAEVAAGTFATAEDAVRYAIRQAKLKALRDRLDAAVAEGGEFSADDVRRYVHEHRDRLNQSTNDS